MRNLFINALLQYSNIIVAKKLQFLIAFKKGNQKHVGGNSLFKK